MKSQHFFRHHRQPQRTTRADSWLCVLRRGLVSIGLMVVSLQIHEPFTPAQDQPERQESVREVTPREITTPSSAPSSANRPALAMPHVLDQILPEVRYLPNDRMELVPVPGDASLEDYLEYLRQRREQSRHAAAMIAVSQVELKGDVERDVARLQARVVVDVAGTERTPQRVALRLNEAALLQVKVSQEEVLFAGRDAEQGYQWWLPGAGRYEFHLTLAVGLRKTNPPRRRLVLSLPASPVNSLRLTMPERDIAPRLLPEDALLEVSTVEGKTEIFATGFGSRLDLSWQSLPLTAHPTVSLDVNTTVLVRGSSEGLFLDATQQVRALQGAFRQLQVQLPPGSELLQLECADLVDSQTDPEHPLEMGISLANPTAGPVTLRWRVRLPAQQGQKVILEGFRVEHAKRQAGSLGLLELEDARWAVSESGEAHLERMSLAEFRSINNGVPVVRAYRFYAQPFRLIVGLEPIPPLFEVQPLLAVMAAEDELRLEARYRVRLYRGRLSQIFLRWPGWQRESWVLEGIEPRGSLVSSFSTSEPGQDDAILIELSPQAPKEWGITTQRPASNPTWQ
ncbi:MAG: hypothetical protein KatS3mg113_0185 [Planctomycetaceae bacterium]|nr:MAG: hypothetical protein KatS3mg113_0185 [Planctomycetaceae bacterium]